MHQVAIKKWREERDTAAVEAAIARLKAAAATTENLVPATIELARARGTVGEWARTLREVFGEYRGPTGIGGVRTRSGPEIQTVRDKIKAIADASGGRPIRLLVGKPGLDGHSNGAEQIAVAARDAGMEVIYQVIRLSPAEIAAAARDEDVDVVGLSILSGSHLALVPQTLAALAAAGVDAPVVVGGIIPDADRAELEAGGVARVYTPKDYRLAEMMSDIAELARDHRLLNPQAGADSRR